MRRPGRESCATSQYVARVRVRRVHAGAVELDRGGRVEPAIRLARDLHHLLDAVGEEAERARVGVRPEPGRDQLRLRDAIPPWAI